MIRFIFNFIFFGVLFYAIAHFFPDAFQKLVHWAETIYHFFVDAAYKLVDWVSHNTKPHNPPSPQEPSKVYETLKLFFHQ